MAMILSAFISKFGELLSDLAKEEVEMLWGVPGEIEKLQNKLRIIRKVLADAERKRINDEAVDDWLKQLKDVMYDADDILDLCRIKADKCSEGSSSTSSVRFSFPLLPRIRKPAVDNEIGMKIRKLNERLEEIWRSRSQFDLQINSPDKQEVTYQISRQTSPVGEIDIVGSQIEEDTRSLVDLLIKDDRRRNILVFAIVGAGGIGKTTLAKRIYNDQRIKEEFHSKKRKRTRESSVKKGKEAGEDQPPVLSVKKWVCVSQEFDEIKLLKDILDDDKKDRAGDQSKSSLEPKVESSLRGKKLFLVLDDVWNSKVWCDLLCNTLKSCATGSRILITTRNEKVAMEMMAVKIHLVEKLSSEDSWSLLCKKVVLTGEEGEIQDVKDIGKEIIRKCDGLPLAIKAVAGVLLTKERTRRAWNGVLESTTWSASGLPKEVKGALYLSFEDLPSNMKQCFIYCSLFPEDFLIHVSHITPLWIAEGFVKAEGSSTMEEIAEEYYRELIMRNLLQPWNNMLDICQMHDLLHCLGRYLAQDESLIVSRVHKVGSSNGPMKLRRVFVRNNRPMTEILDILVKQDSLRTLLWERSLKPDHLHLRSLARYLAQDESSIVKDVQKVYANRPMTEIVNVLENKDSLRTQMDVIFNKLSRLRVLGISNSDSKIQRVPDSLGNLIHLRYLSISGTKISVIPETIGNLRNLQILIIFDCKSLSRLPNSIVNLHNLRILNLDFTKVVGMPAGLGRLQNLHSLHGFMPQSNRTERWCTIEELRSLTCLRDLRIDQLECISSSSEARAAELRNKPKLSRLWLDCTRDLQPSEEEMRRIKEVFGELHPPPSLEGLRFDNYFSHEFPKWMAETSSSASFLFPNLRCLTLYRCKYCKGLPPFGLLPNLEYLHISDADSVIDVGSEFLVGTSSTSSGSSRAGVDTSKYAFPRLRTLQIVHMHNWREWHWDKGTQAMPCLKYLILSDCPKLMFLPEGLLLHTTSLTKLTISDAGSLTTIENLLSLKELYIKNNPYLEKVSDLPALTTLKVKHCPKLQVVENLHTLRRMKLKDYDMESLPSYLLKGVHTAHLEGLEIRCSMELIRNICQRDSPQCQIIQGIQQVRVYSQDKSVHALYDKSPFSFTTNFNTTTSSSCFEMASSSSGTAL